ncbi:MAG: YitT family protein [Clostridia bacterium]|nr:YitT family protein [Clostridia bacterium]
MQEVSTPPEEESKLLLPKKITKEDLQAENNSKRGKATYLAKTILFLLISSFLISFAAYSLIAPNAFTIGGASGIAILINTATHGIVPQFVIVFAINFPLVVCSFFFVKKKFAILSAANIVLQTVWLIVLEEAFPTFQITFGSGGEKIFAAIAGGLCIGTATALALKIGGSTGGADIVAVMIQRKFSASSIARVILAINSVIILSSLLVFYDGQQNLAHNVLPIMMSIFEVYVESNINESITNGFHSAIEFKIITRNPEEMSIALMRELSRGVTAIPTKGMYTKEESTMLVCVVHRRQVGTLQRIIKSVDPDSFAVMSGVSQVLGLGFYRSEL